MIDPKLPKPYLLRPDEEPRYHAISKTAADRLGGLVDGNGFTADQVRLLKEETEVHPIPAAVIINLTPDINQAQQHGNVPVGKVLSADNVVQQEAEGQIATFLEGTDMQKSLRAGMDRAPGKGFGDDVPVLALPGTQKEYSVVHPCAACGGAMFVNCQQCHAAGVENCMTCRGQGFSSCNFCFGTGMVQDAQGRHSCAHCQQTGRLPCVQCRGQRVVTCSVCHGQRQVGCPQCGQSGYMTNIYQVAFKAQFKFDPDWRAVTPDTRKVIDALGGIRKLAAEGHVDVEWQPPVVKDGHLLIPCTGILPVAAAEFTVAGKRYPALVAGLLGTIVKIEAVLDPAIKPGIAALMKLSKGPLAVQALIDTACRYKIIRQVLAALARSSKKTVYAGISRNYPLVISEKYAKAAVLYAAQALLSISDGPRYKGLAFGTLASAAPAAFYYMTPLRQFLLAALAQRGLERHIALADIVTTILGVVVSIFVIRLKTAAAFRRMLPSSVQFDRAGLPSAGKQGWMAVPLALLACLIVASLAPEKPQWILQLTSFRLK